MRISDWSSTCALPISPHSVAHGLADHLVQPCVKCRTRVSGCIRHAGEQQRFIIADRAAAARRVETKALRPGVRRLIHEPRDRRRGFPQPEAVEPRSEEHTSELQSLMRISYAVFCL